MGIPTLISTATASGAANVSITSGIDSTYDEYMFVVTDYNPTDGPSGALSNSAVFFTFQCSIDGGSNYNVATTSTHFRLAHYEDDSVATPDYYTDGDQAQGTAFQILDLLTGAGTDESAAGILHLFSPSSTTYVKHFYSRFNSYYGSTSATLESYVAGYFNDANDINAIQFKPSSGSMDCVIQMYGIA